MTTSGILSVPASAMCPDDYLRIVSPTFAIPSDPRTAIPVGLLACQRDPLIRQLESTVISCVLSQPVQNNGKKAKKSVIAPDLPSDPLLEIVLHDTVIFPEGGGQPTDTGIIKTLHDGIEWDVVQAKRHGSHAIHYVRVPNGDVNAAIIAFTPGEKVVVSLGQEGWTRRYDHMTMHTSQHLLSALLETRLTTLIPGMSKEEIVSIQHEANQLVFEGRKVYVEVQELDQVLEQSKEQPKLENGRAVGKALPADYTGGVKRVVIIDGIDRNPCCGTHLPSIHNLQLFLLPHTEALSRSSTTSARLYFLSGPRLLTHLTSTHDYLTTTASTLSCGAPSVPERVTQVVEERRRAEKRVADLEIQIAKSAALVMMLNMNKTSDVTRTVYTEHMHRVDDTTNALGLLNAISLAFMAEQPSSPYLFVLSSSPSSQTSTNTSVILIFGSNEKMVKDVGDALKSKLGVKGGGKGTRWSGKFTGVWKHGREDSMIGDVLRNASIIL